MKLAKRIASTTTTKRSFTITNNSSPILRSLFATKNAHHQPIIAGAFSSSASSSTSFTYSSTPRLSQASVFAAAANRNIIPNHQKQQQQTARFHFSPSLRNNNNNNKMMKAVLVKPDMGGVTSAMYIGEVPKPELKTEDYVLVRVKATAVNRADTLQRKGLYPPPPGESEVMGLEVAGVVEEVGSNAAGQWKKGDRVMALLAGGGYAQYASVHKDLLMKVPDHMSMTEAAGIPEVWLTAYQALFTIGGLQEKGRVLIHAGASGVGTAAIALCKKRNCSAIITTSSTRKTEACKNLGATLAISYEEDATTWDKKVLEHTNNKGVDVILDFIAAKYFKQNLNSLGMDGKLVILASMGGSQMPEFDLRPVFRKRASIICSTLRSRSLEYKIALTRDFVRDFLGDFSKKPSEDKPSLEPIIDSVFEVDKIAEAHERVESNANVGKVIIKVEDE